MSKSLILSLLLCLHAAAAPYQTFYDYKLQEFATMKPSALVFLGDSLTMRHDWSSFEASNMGIDGDGTAGILSRMHLASEADTIVLMIGVNDILNRLPVETLQENYMKIFSHISSKQRLYVLSLLPVIDARQTKSINQQIRSMNRWLSGQVPSHGFTFVNIYPDFLDEKKEGLKTEYTVDGIHLSETGYALWEKILRELLEQD